MSYTKAEIAVSTTLIRAIQGYGGKPWNPYFGPGPHKCVLPYAYRDH